MKHMYDYTFQFINRDKGEITRLDKWRLEQSLSEFMQQVGLLTPWLSDPQRRCVITREGSDVVIDLMHDEMCV